MLKNKLNFKKYIILNVFVFIIFFSCEQENKVENPTIGETSISINNNTLNDIYGSELDKLKNIAITRNYRLPVSVAEQIAIETATKMREFEGILTKSSLSISSVHKIKGNEKELVLDTKAEDTKNDSVSDMYLINFENNQGYVLMSADERASGIISYNSEGQLKDTLDNPGQSVLLSSADNFIEEKREQFRKNEEQLILLAEEDMFKTLSKEIQDSLIREGIFDINGKRILNKSMTAGCITSFKSEEEKLNSNEKKRCNYLSCSFSKSTSIRNNKIRKIEIIGPLVRTLWNQKPDYNDKMITNCKDGSKAPVGCVAVAVGQILAYHKKPKIFLNETMEWDKITTLNGNFSDYYDIKNNKDLNISKYAYQIPYLLAYLGIGSYLDTKVYKNECQSGSNINQATTTFRKFGYFNADIKNYNNDIVIKEIKNKRPVYIDGCTNDNSWWIFKSYSNCHAWVLDGSLKFAIDKTDYVYSLCEGKYRVYNYTEIIDLVHNNFGWGKGNASTGWYNIGLFNGGFGVNKGRSYESDEFITNNSNERNYNDISFNNNNNDKNFKYRNSVIVGIK